jgi:hypothetical protein
MRLALSQKTTRKKPKSDSAGEKAKMSSNNKSPDGIPTLINGLHSAAGNSGAPSLIKTQSGDNVLIENQLKAYNLGSDGKCLLPAPWVLMAVYASKPFMLRKAPTSSPSITAITPFDRRNRNSVSLFRKPGPSWFCRVPQSSDFDAALAALNGRVAPVT